MQCTTCLFINPAGLNYCGKCGAVLSPSQPVKQIHVPMFIWVGLGVFALIVIIAAALNVKNRVPQNVSTSTMASAPEPPKREPKISAGTQFIIKNEVGLGGSVLGFTIISNFLDAVGMSGPVA